LSGQRKEDGCILRDKNNDWPPSLADMSWKISSAEMSGKFDTTSKINMDGAAFVYTLKPKNTVHGVNSLQKRCSCLVSSGNFSE